MREMAIFPTQLDETLMQTHINRTLSLSLCFNKTHTLPVCHATLVKLHYLPLWFYLKSQWYHLLSALSINLYTLGQF